MKITGKTVKCPTIKEMNDKYKGFFEELESLIRDKIVYNEVRHYIIQLEWCSLFHELLAKEHSIELTDARKRQEYERYYEKILESVSKLKPYLYCSEELKLNIPLKQPDSHQRLKELLEDDREALNVIYSLYPFTDKRSNSREQNNKRIEKFLDMLENPDRYIKAARWQEVQPATNKVFKFFNLSESQVLSLQDENGNDYTEITKIKITDINGKTTLEQDIDYIFDGFGGIIILYPLLQKCQDIKVVISTKLSKFKSISS